MADKDQPNEHDQVMAIVGSTLGMACDDALQRLLGDDWESMGLMLVLCHPDAPEALHVSTRLDEETVNVLISALASSTGRCSIPLPDLQPKGAH